MPIPDHEKAERLRAARIRRVELLTVLASLSAQELRKMVTCLAIAKPRLRA